MRGRADDKFDVVILDKKECTYSYFADPMYVFMDTEYNQYEVEAEFMGDALNYLEESMPCEVVFYEGKALSVAMPNSLVREIIYTEPAVKGRHQRSCGYLYSHRWSFIHNHWIPQSNQLGNYISIGCK